jgi:hypothetical protein
MDAWQGTAFSVPPFRANVRMGNSFVSPRSPKGVPLPGAGPPVFEGRPGLARKPAFQAAHAREQRPMLFLKLNCAKTPDQVVNRIGLQECPDGGNRGATSEPERHLCLPQRFTQTADTRGAGSPPLSDVGYCPGGRGGGDASAWSRRPSRKICPRAAWHDRPEPNTV